VFSLNQLIKAEMTTLALVNNVSSKRIKQNIEKLVGFVTRHILSRTDSDSIGIGAARKSIRR